MSREEVVLSGKELRVSVRPLLCCCRETPGARFPKKKKNLQKKKNTVGEMRTDGWLVGR